jgi:hypothetical protein
MHIVKRCATWKIANGCGEPCFAGATISMGGVSVANSQAGQPSVIADLMRTLWRVSLMLVLNRSLLNKGYIPMNVRFYV